MSARDTIRVGPHIVHPLYPHLHATIGLDPNHQRVFEWRDEKGNIIFNSPFTDLAEAYAEHLREEGVVINDNSPLSELLQQLTDKLEEMETPRPGSTDSPHNSTLSPDRK